MGKTSLVNKALSNLNPKSKLTNIFLLWFLLLPTIFINKEYSGKIFYAFLWFLIPFSLVVCLSYYFLSTKNEKINKSKSIFKSNVLYHFFNPNYQKEKYSFIRNLRLFIIYYLFFLTLIFVNSFSKEFSTHHKFWGLTVSFICLYIIVNLVRDIISYYNDLIKKVSIFHLIKKVNILLLVVFVFILGTLVFLFFINKYLFFIILLIIFNFISKYIKSKIQNKKYNTAFSSLFAFIDFKQHLKVSINLGKDNLTEKDVFKYITNEICRVYNSWYYNYKNLKRLLSISTLMVFFFIIFNSAYHLLDNNYIYKQTNGNFQLAKYFPSQLFLENNLVKNNCNIDDYIENKIDFDNDLFIIEGEKIEYGYKKIKILENPSIKRKFFIPTKKENEEGKNEDGILKGKNEEYTAQSYLNKISYQTGKITNLLDYAFVKTYVNIRTIILGDQIDKKTGVFKDIIVFIYPKTPVFVVIFSIVLLILFYRFTPSFLIPFKSHKTLIRELNALQKQIDASIVIEKDSGATSGIVTLFNFKKQSSYKPLESKDISQRLIHILDKLDNIKPIFTKIKFILIFDELDKINPHHNTSLSIKEDEYEVKDENRYYARRKERINLILSGMKHFLNTAKVKSIFIAGREMYDAALAGISDRESNLDSIFSDNKIYVKSFYTEGDDGNLNDITSMTENFVCQFIIPAYFKNKNRNELPSLELYNKFLIAHYNEDEAESKKDIKNLEKDNRINKLKRIKTISTLKDFIKYLTYRSNGAPRKLSNLFDSYVNAYTLQDLKEPDRIIYAKNAQSMCLHFSYYDQYKFSYISYLVTPIFMGLGNYISDYSDKLLVSISYMLDHLFKHHKFGLSFRSLSLTPEIIDVNKEPEFRNFLDKLIGFLSKSHLRKIVSGIYDYKFNSKIACELKFISKINELEAAAFNFTLDESIELKRHFHKKLKYLENKNNTQVVINSTNSEDYKNAISLIHMNLGDLHFNDEEYGDAIEQYLEAVQIIRQKNPTDMVLYDFIVYVRNKLKLGLAYEKNKVYDSAQMTYAELTDLILRKRNIPLRKLGLVRFFVSKDHLYEMLNGKDSSKIMEIAKEKNIEINKDFNKNIINYFFNDLYTSEIIILGRPKNDLLKNLNDEKDWKKIWQYKDMETFYDFGDAEYVFKNISNLALNFKSVKRNYYFTTSENIRILYQPIIAKLHLVEKSSPNKLKDVDILRAVDEFSFFKRPLKTKEKRVIVAEFYNKLGDLLYFKNGTINTKLKKLLFLKLQSDNYSLTYKKLLMSPIDATVFYTKSLATLLIPSAEDHDLKKINIRQYYKEIDGFNDFNNIENTILKITSVLDDLHINGLYQLTYSANYLTSVANGIIDLAGSLLSFTEDTILFNKDKDKNNEINLTLCIKLFYHANLIFKRIGEHRLAKSQLIKILHILREKDKNSKIILKQIDVKLKNKKLFIENIINTCIKYIYRTYEQASRPEIKKVRKTFEIPTDNNQEIYKNTTIMAEINEVIHLHWLIYLKVFKTNKKHEKNMYKKGILFKTVFVNSYKNTNPYTTISTKLNRVLELSQRLQVNKLIFNHVFNTKESEIKLNENEIYSIISNNKYTSNINNLKKILILDSIGACSEIIKSHNIFDLNYVTTSNLTLAKAHANMSFWCDELEKLNTTFNNDEKKEFSKNINKVLNSKNTMYLSPYYHLDLAQQYNYKVSSFHQRGEALQNFLKNNSYLDDFYNDNLTHFTISIERNHFLNNMEIEKDFTFNKINNLDPTKRDLVTTYTNYYYE